MGLEPGSAWLTWYGLQIGLSLCEMADLPYGLLLDLIAVEQVKHERAKMILEDDTDAIPDLE